MKIKDPSTLLKGESKEFYSSSSDKRKRIMKNVLKNLEKSTTLYETRVDELRKIRGGL